MLCKQKIDKNTTDLLRADWLYTLFNWVSCVGEFWNVLNRRQSSADRRRQLSCVGEGIYSDATQLDVELSCVGEVSIATHRCNSIRVELSCITINGPSFEPPCSKIRHWLLTASTWSTSWQTSNIQRWWDGDTKQRTLWNLFNVQQWCQDNLLFVRVGSTQCYVLCFQDWERSLGLQSLVVTGWVTGWGFHHTWFSSVFWAPLHLWPSWSYIYLIFLLHFFTLHFGELRWDWSLTWLTNHRLQCCDTVGLVMWPIKSSQKWPIMCRVG